MTVALGDYMKLAFSTLTKANKSDSLRASSHATTQEVRILLAGSWYTISAPPHIRNWHTHLEAVSCSSKTRAVLDRFKAETSNSSFSRDRRSEEKGWGALLERRALTKPNSVLFNELHTWLTGDGGFSCSWKTGWAHSFCRFRQGKGHRAGRTDRATVKVN